MALIFGMGATEIGLILIIALIVLGPQKLPELTLKLGRLLGELKRATTEFQREFMRAQQEIEQLKDETVGEVKRTFSSPPKPGQDVPSSPQPRIAPPEGDRMAANKPIASTPAFRGAGNDQTTSINQPEAAGKTDSSDTGAES